MLKDVKSSVSGTRPYLRLSTRNVVSLSSLEKTWTHSYSYYRLRCAYFVQQVCVEYFRSDQNLNLNSGTTQSDVDALLPVANIGCKVNFDLREERYAIDGNTTYR